MRDSIQGMIDKIKERAPELYANATSVPDNILSIFRKKWDIHSPSKEFKKIFSYAMQGGENGLKDEAPKLYKQADEVASTFTDRLQAGVSADGLVSKMRAAVAEGKSFVAEQLTANVVHTVDMQNADKQKVVLQGNIVNHLEVDGREFAVATAQYMSEELAWEGNGL